ADALADEIIRLTHRAAASDVEVARGEIAQGKHGETDVAPIALVDTVEILRHRPLTAQHVGVLHGAAQHLGTLGPRATAAEDHRERDAVRLHLPGGERHDAGVVGTRQRDRKIGHRQRFRASKIARGFFTSSWSILSSVTPALPGAGSDKASTRHRASLTER